MVFDRSEHTDGGPRDFVPPEASVERLDIPEGTELVPRGAVEGRRTLVSVTVPPSVRAIGERAFANCERLERVALSEGLISLGDSAFNGCENLRAVTVPDSVRDIGGGAFRNSGVAFPVLNASGDTLLYCPAQAAGREFTVPEGVRRIVRGAFSDLPGLTRIHLPQSLERIDAFAFVRCGLESVTLPERFKELAPNAFYRCPGLRKLRCAGEDPVRGALIDLWARGGTFLIPQRGGPPQGGAYWREAEFRALAGECARGGVAAMERMARFFEDKSAEHPGEPFFAGAANFWSYRAYANGSAAQRGRLEELMIASPEDSLPSACLTERLEGTARGAALNALGFLAFDPDREYSFAGLDGCGVVEVSAYESEDGPDGDGFGRETYYDWWYLDAALEPLPGVECLSGYSTVDRRIEEVRLRFLKAHAAACAASSW